MQLSIGDFSRMTHLSVKALRHYHELGLLEPADVDPQTGYRSYEAAQVPRAQVIRRFRELGMPVEQVKAVLDAPDLGERNALIVSHLKRMEQQLEQIHATVSSLRTLLEPAPARIAVEYRSVPPVRTASIVKTVKLGEIEPWWSDAFAEIYDTLRAAGVRPAGPSGGLYPTALFTDEIGEVVVFVPIADAFEPSGRIRIIELPQVELAVAVHQGPLRDADRTYGALGTHVAERALGVEGPIREHYLVTSEDISDETQLRTEICWPIFRADKETTMSIDLPGPIAGYLKANNERDIDAMLAPFDEDASVKDEGEEHHGRSAIRAWMEDTTRRYDATIEAKDVTEANGKTVVSGLVSGNFPGTPVLLDFAFTLSGSKIRRLEIT